MVSPMRVLAQSDIAWYGRCPLESRLRECEERLASCAQLQRASANACMAALARRECAESSSEAARHVLVALEEQERRCRCQGSSAGCNSLRLSWEAKLRGLEEKREAAAAALAGALANLEREHSQEALEREQLRRSILESRAAFQVLDQLRGTEMRRQFSCPEIQVQPRHASASCASRVKSPRSPGGLETAARSPRISRSPQLSGPEGDRVSRRVSDAATGPPRSPGPSTRVVARATPGRRELRRPSPGRPQSPRGRRAGAAKAPASGRSRSAASAVASHLKLRQLLTQRLEEAPLITEVVAPAGRGGA